MEVRHHSSCRFDGNHEIDGRILDEIEVPVFLVLTDRKEENAYALPIKQYIRKNYLAFIENQSFSVRVNKSNLFDVDRFYAEYRKERGYNSFKSHLVSLLVNVERHADFIASNKGRHEYFEVDPIRHLYLISLIESCSFLARYLDIHWPVPSLQELYAMDIEFWKDRFCTLHEGSLTQVLDKLTTVFPEIVARSLEIVNHTEHSFWANTENAMFNLINRNDVEDITQSVAARLHFFRL